MQTQSTQESVIRVRYAETDQMGFAYYGNYFAWFEVARTDFLRQVGFRYRDLEAEGVRLAVLDASCCYHSPAFYDDDLRIRCRLTGVKRLKVHFSYEIVNAAGKRIASGETTLASLNSQGRPAELPRPVYERLKECLAE